jgi:hypothetical protein
VADDKHVTFDATPGGGSFAEVTWILPDAGMMGRDKTVPRSEATHAKITEVGGSNAGTRVVTAGEADAYIAQVQRYLAERDAAAREEAARRQTAIAALVSTCPHCDQPRAYQGVRQLQSGSVGAEMMFGELFTVSNAGVHWYMCQTCGSVELFADGLVRHPLSGNA